jgi:putative ABC transport system permease protein
MLASLSGEVSKYPFLFDGEGQWSNSAFYTYALLRPDQPVSNIESGLAAFADRHMGDFARSRGFEPGFSLQAVPDIHLRSDLAMEREPIGNVRYILLFAAIAGFILVIASINFMNLATARAGKRLTEKGLR